MALSLGFKVKLVLLPEGQDPDSFIKEKGSEDFQEFIQSHKRDFIEFILEIGLQETKDDPVKKAKLVSDVAEIISKINKAEDFTIQQYYIQKSANDLGIEEEGLINLVNKFIRERLQQEGRKQQRSQEQEEQDAALAESYEFSDEENKAASDLLNLDHKEEWQLLKVLLEYGPKPYEEDTVAYSFFSTIDIELFQSPLAKKMVTAYHNFWEENEELPELDFFVKHEDKNIRQKAADLLTEAHVPSSHWKDQYKIEVLHGEDIYQQETKSTFAYFQLKLIRKLLQENWKKLENEHSSEQVEILMKTHLSLKEKEKDLDRKSVV